MIKKINLYLIILLALSFFAGLLYSLYRNQHAAEHTDHQHTRSEQTTAFNLTRLSYTDLLTDKIIRFENLAIDKPVLFNVWGSWCISCRVEHPYLLSLAEQGITIIGVNYLDDKNKAKRWLKELGDPYTFNLFDNRGQVGADLGVIGAPESYVINAQGQVLARHRGVLDQETFSQKLEPHLR